MALAKFTEEKIEFYLEGMEVYEEKHCNEKRRETYEEKMGWCCRTTQHQRISYWEVI